MDACTFQGVPRHVQDNALPTAVLIAGTILSTLAILAILFTLLWWGREHYNKRKRPRTDDVELGERNSSRRGLGGVRSVPAGTTTQPRPAPATRASHAPNISQDFEEVPLSLPSTPIQTAQAVPITQVQRAEAGPDVLPASSPTRGEAQSPHFRTLFTVDVNPSPKKGPANPTSEQE